ncbi:MAG TPA: type II toxin-antitoxin system VapC family toxin [Thermodesulfobacteriota bacterium]|nr:type II toxin-antitoxin system VapC family toxin [Thermodesulfobacteriota bacterium]
MSRFLLDSDVIIWHLRGREEVTNALRDLQRFGLPACSAISVLEIQLGVKKGEEEKTDRFLESLKIFDVDMETANKAAQLIRRSKVKGMTLDLPDSVIAATCILHDLTLVTYNTKHYPLSEMKFHALPAIKS